MLEYIIQEAVQAGVVINKAPRAPDSACAPRDCRRVGNAQAVPRPPAEKTPVYDHAPSESDRPQNTLPR